VGQATDEDPDQDLDVGQATDEDPDQDVDRATDVAVYRRDQL
jgi:hypothetical protein